MRVSFTLTKEIDIQVLPLRKLLELANSCPVTTAQCERLSEYLTKKVSRCVRTLN